MDLPIAITAHLLSAIVWVGGMFFAYFIVRPATGSVLDDSNRLILWSALFKRFFRWVWLAIILLLLSGYWMIFGVYGGMKNVGIHVHAMHGLAWLMILIFVFLNVGPIKRFYGSIEAKDWPSAANSLSSIRQIFAINLSLGLITSAIAAGGKFLN